MDALGLRARKKFYYTFDYGDDWEHVVEVLSVNDQEPAGRAIQGSWKSPVNLPLSIPSGMRMTTRMCVGERYLYVERRKTPDGAGMGGRAPGLQCPEPL